jgi:aminopeptidase
LDQLARQLVRYSTQVKKGDRVWIDCFDVPNYVAVALIRAVVEAKGLPVVKLHDTLVSRELMIHASEEQYDVLAKNNLDLMKEMDCYIAVRGSHNITENSDVPAKQMQMVMAKMRPFMNERVNNTRWRSRRG